MAKNVVAQALGTRFFERLVASPRGRAFVLRFLQSTEESDEKAVFDNLLARVGDPAFTKMVKVHRDDEDRHAEIYRAAVARAVAEGGGDPGDIPGELRVIQRLDDLLGGWSEAFAKGTIGIVEMYVLLLVVEERAVNEWPLIEKALRKSDPAAADDVAGVLRDEARHVKYARAIARRYAPSEEALETTIARVRSAETIAYAETVQAFSRIAVERDLLTVGPIERLGWKSLVYLEGLRGAA